MPCSRPHERLEREQQPMRGWRSVLPSTQTAVRPRRRALPGVQRGQPQRREQHKDEEEVRYTGEQWCEQWCAGCRLRRGRGISERYAVHAIMRQLRTIRCHWYVRSSRAPAVSRDRASAARARGTGERFRTKARPLSKHQLSMFTLTFTIMHVHHRGSYAALNEYLLPVCGLEGRRCARKEPPLRDGKEPPPTARASPASLRYHGRRN